MQHVKSLFEFVFRKQNVYECVYDQDQADHEKGKGVVLSALLYSIHSNLAINYFPLVYYD